MATRTPQSAISYNTPEFLREKLENWQKTHLIQSWIYIKHKGEDGDKDHIHVRIVPNKTLDVMDLTDSLREFKSGEIKPLGVLGWRQSKEEDWILYAVHDPDYLSQKYVDNHEHEKIRYSYTDLVCSDDLDAESLYLRARATLKHTASSIISQIKEGKSGIDLITEGNNPFTVSTILRMFHASDYERLKSSFIELDRSFNSLNDAYKSLQSKHDSLLSSVRSLGLLILQDDDGNYYVSKPDADCPF